MLLHDRFFISIKHSLLIILYIFVGFIQLAVHLHSSMGGAFFSSIKIYFFLLLHKNICCGYSLEASRRDASNEYPQHMFFCGEISKMS